MIATADQRGIRLATLAGAAGAILGVALYLLASSSTFRIGFPLDDAWIHQTYARNLAARGEWAFVPGEPSGGSTAPFWTVLLAVGSWLGAGAQPWAYVLGTVALAGGAAAAVRLFRPAGGQSRGWVVWLAILFSLEWHLIWAAASGMEVILLVALAALVMRMSLPAVRRPLLAGVVVGCGIWIRPDAITLGMIPLLSVAAEAGLPVRTRAARLLGLAAGAAIPFVPYLLFNLATAGTLWPSTFYAKQAEYAELRRAPYAARFLRLLAAPLAGSGALLFPGAVFAAVAAVRAKRWAELGPLLWALVYLGTFAMLLPVAYQHGRYQIPILAVIVVFGWQGIAQAASAARRPAWRVLSRAWAASAVVVTFAFTAIGARAYALDVAIIESEMVDAARWIAAHTEGRALVGAHDIGALGYFGGRDILDLAGLAEADVIPFLRDEARLAEYMNRQGVDYLMTFPGWYPSLVRCGDVVYASAARFSPEQGGENMHVVRWPSVFPPGGCMLYSPTPAGAALSSDE